MFVCICVYVLCAYMCMYTIFPEPLGSYESYQTSVYRVEPGGWRDIEWKNDALIPSCCIRYVCVCVCVVNSFNLPIHERGNYFVYKYILFKCQVICLHKFLFIIII